MSYKEFFKLRFNLKKSNPKVILYQNKNTDLKNKISWQYIAGLVSMFFLISMIIFSSLIDELFSISNLLTTNDFFCINKLILYIEKIDTKYLIAHIALEVTLVIYFIKIW